MSKVSVFSVKITKMQYSKWIIITNHMGFEHDANIQITNGFMFEDYF
jgi:hypothetical protein